MPGLRGAQEGQGLGLLLAPASPWGLACLRVGFGGPCLLVLPKCPEKTPLKNKHESSKGQRLRCLEGVREEVAASNARALGHSANGLGLSQPGQEQGTTKG